eukprot:Skav217523  [mRNA]  locus=scaffold4186:19480:24947:+ [translate_table: standard]
MAACVALLVTKKCKATAAGSFGECQGEQQAWFSAVNSHRMHFAAAELGDSGAQPVIAILASDCGILYNCSSYIPASYASCPQENPAWHRLTVIKQFSTGADEEFDYVLAHVNGVMTIGGFFKMKGTAESHIRKIYDYAMEAASRGEVFPLWATCVGIHDLVQVATGKVYAEFLTRTFAENLALPLHFQDVEAAGRLLFDDELFPGSQRLRDWLQSNALTFHHHQWGITPATFESIKESMVVQTCAFVVLVVLFVVPLDSPQHIPGGFVCDPSVGGFF